MERLTVKDAPSLATLAGLEPLGGLDRLEIIGAPRLRDTSTIRDTTSLAWVKFEGSTGLGSLEDVANLVGLVVLGFSDCGDIPSLAPIEGLRSLDRVYAWGTTKILDGDLSPLTRLPKLRDLRMRNRHGYRPTVAEVMADLPHDAGTGIA